MTKNHYDFEIVNLVVGFRRVSSGILRVKLLIFDSKRKLTHNQMKLRFGLESPM